MQTEKEEKGKRKPGSGFDPPFSGQLVFCQSQGWFSGGNRFSRHQASYIIKTLAAKNAYQAPLLLHLWPTLSINIDMLVLSSCRNWLRSQGAKKSRYNSPHRIEKCAVVDKTQQFVGRRHVVGDRLLSVVEKGVRSPDFTGQEVVER